jgi:hypothetical protein
VNVFKVKLLFHFKSARIIARCFFNETAVRKVSLNVIHQCDETLQFCIM